jgi:DNA-binding NarL/FixJ family response regulator
MRILSNRERQIVELLITGADNKEIACQLHIASRTVKAHFNRMFLRYGITSGVKRVKLATMFYGKNFDTVNVASLPYKLKSGESLKEWLRG